MLGKYKHYKGNYYEVIALAKHSETQEDFVVYKSLYGDRQIWVRPFDSFFANIDINDKTVPRFEKSQNHEFYTQTN